MKNINVTVICAGVEEYPDCFELLAECPAIHIVARPTGCNEPGASVALGRSHVLLMDETALEQAGHQAVRTLHDSFPAVSSLLIMENCSENKVLAALSLGVQGVIERTELISQLTRAVMVIYTGEAWLSRGMVQPLREQLNREKAVSCWQERFPVLSDWERLN